MALFDPAALKTGVRVREVWGWALFDAANSGYSTVILTAVFNTYFVSVICGSADWATFLWTAVVAASNILCLILMPAFSRAAHPCREKALVLYRNALLHCGHGPFDVYGPGNGGHRGASCDCEQHRFQRRGIHEFGVFAGTCQTRVPRARVGLGLEFGLRRGPCDIGALSDCASDCGGL